jgi:hypothetical protein
MIGAATTHSAIGWWDIITRIGVGISIFLGLRALGVLKRTRYAVHGVRSPLRDITGAHTAASFVMTFINRGATPVTFLDFEMSIPRLGDHVLEENGTYIPHVGAEWFVDGERRGFHLGAQAFTKVNVDTRRIVVEPQSSRTEFFPLDLFQIDSLEAWRHWPDNFDPILTFEDSFGKRYFCDSDGTHRGDYQYPHRAALEAVVTTGAATGVRVSRWSLVPWWWREKTLPYPKS